jgi:hypothetical protein
VGEACGHESIQQVHDEISNYFSNMNISAKDACNPKSRLHSEADVTDFHFNAPTSDSSKLRLAEMPIKYDAIYQKLIKRPVVKEDWETAHLGFKTRKNMCTRLPRTAQSQRQRAPMNEAETDQMLQSNVFKPLGSIESKTFRSR